MLTVRSITNLFARPSFGGRSVFHKRGRSLRAGITGSVGFLRANLVRYLCETGLGDLEVVPFYCNRKTIR
jgi:hypothetical protein